VLVTFEGLEGAGKSALMHEVAVGLRSTLGPHVWHLADISQSPTGQRLREVFRVDELFGEGNVGSTVMSRCLAAAADLFYFDGTLIAPMVAAGGVVLKERHVDSLMSHQGSSLSGRFGWSEERVHEWLSSVVEPLQVRATLTILVEAPSSHRERRLRERMHRAGADLGRTEAEFHRKVFAIHAEWYERLRLKDEDRWLIISNPDGEFARAADRAIAAILDRARRRVSDRARP
jgi:thymidylate kinase